MRTIVLRLWIFFGGLFLLIKPAFAQNILTDGGFSSTTYITPLGAPPIPLNTWCSWSNQATVTSLDASVSDGVCSVSFLNSGNNTWDVQLSQYGFPLVQEHHYKLTFYVKADADRYFGVYLGENEGSWTNLNPNYIQHATTTWQMVTIEFDATAVFALHKLSFEIGAENIKMYFDNIYLQDMGAASPPAIEIIGSSIPPYDWSAGADLQTTDGINYTLSNYSMPAGMVKFRQNKDWSINWGSISFPTGKGYQDGSNVPVTEGTYNISFNRLTGEYNFTCMVCNKSTIGLTGTAVPPYDGSAELGMTSTDGVLYTVNNVVLIAGQVTFIQDSKPGITWGGTAFPKGVGTTFAGAITVPQKGTYNISYNRSTGEYNFDCLDCVYSIGIIGSSVPPYDWSADVDMVTTDNVTYTLSNYPFKTGEVKFRQNHDWSVNWGSDTFPSGTGVSGGPNIPVAAGNYNVTFNRLTGQYNFECLLCYCTTGLYDITYGCTNNAAINDFSFADIQQKNTGCSGQLADYTSLVGNLARGESYLFTVGSSSYVTDYEFVGIWIDLNDNGKFTDEGEMLFASAAGGQLSGVLKVPVGAPLGSHRMRVRLKADYAANPFLLSDACTFYYNGEAHDYTVLIGELPSCPGLAALSVSNIGKFSAHVKWGCEGCAGPFTAEYGPAGFTPGTGNTAGAGGAIFNTSADTVTLTGLAADKEYDVYVRRSCGANGFSLNFGPQKFITLHDACATIQTITCGQTYTVEITAGTGEFSYYPDQAYSLPGKEQIYLFTPGVTGKYLLKISNSNNSYPAYFIKEASLGCDRYSWRRTSEWMGILNAGTSYYLMVDAQMVNSITREDFTITCAETFDPCSSEPAKVTCGVPVDYTIPPGPGAFEISFGQYFSSGLGKEILYSYTAAANGRMNLTLGWNNQARFLIKEATSGCNSNNWSSLDPVYNYNTGEVSTTACSVKAGSEYYILVDAITTEGASSSFTINCPENWQPGIMAQIACGNEITAAIPAGLGAYDTIASNYSYSPYVGKELVYSFTPAKTGYYRINLLSTNYFQVKYLIKEAGSLDDNGWNFVGATAYSSSGLYTPIALKAGTAYYLMLDAQSTAGATHVFIISCEVPPDPCSSITTLTCGEPVNIMLPMGQGALNSITSNSPYANTGTEKIIKFTAAASDFYMLKITNNDSYGNVLYAIKEAADGCNENNWQYINTIGENKSFLIPQKLTVGKEYYLLLESSYYQIDVSETLEIVCASGNEDPCSHVSAITGCGTPVTAVLGPGFGKYINCGGGYYYGSGIGGPAGKENIYQFTPALTGWYTIKSISGTGQVSFSIKQASAGCNGDGWTCIGSATAPYYPGDPYALLSIPLKLEAGIAYYIMVDANDTTGATHEFEIPCPDIYNPCDNKITLSCGLNYTPVTIPEGAGNYIYMTGYNYSAKGKEAMVEFTPAESGTYRLEISSNGLGEVYMKKSSAGCDTLNWQYLGWSNGYYYSYYYPEMQAGVTYMFLLKAFNYTGAYLNVSMYCPANCTIYADADGDGYGDPNRAFTECGSPVDPTGYAFNKGDCNDANPAVHPGAAEICGNNIDDNCDGQVDENCCTISITCPANTEQSAGWFCSSIVGTPAPVISNSGCTTSTLIWTMTGATTGSSTATGINEVGTRTFNTGTTIVTYTATSSSGAVASCSYTVTIVDNAKPVVVCPPDIKGHAHAHRCSADVDVPKPYIHDNCGVTDLTWIMTGATTGNSPTSGINYVGSQAFNVGLTTVTYTAKDAANNTSSCSFNVRVTGSPNCGKNGVPGKFTNGGLDVKVYPNPSDRYYTMEIQTSSDEPLQLTILDATGRLVKKINAGSQRSIRFGDELRSGLYMIEARQGTDRVMIKIVKQ